MRTRFGTHLALAMTLGLLASLSFAGGALAAETVLTADLAGVTEGDNPGDPDGSGSATITVDPAAGTLCWQLTAKDIMPVAQSHIHLGGSGESGDVVVPLDVDGFEGTSAGCIEPMEDAAVLQEILDDPGAYYVNLHTSDFQGGAIRGQLAAGSGQPNTAVSVNGTSPLLLIGVMMLGLATAIGLRFSSSVVRRR